VALAVTVSTDLDGVRVVPGCVPTALLGSGRLLVGPLVTVATTNFVPTRVAVVEMVLKIRRCRFKHAINISLTSELLFI